MMYDIGELAVPEHITSKPGRLLPHEYDRIKIHPVVGAEIVERARFPYPVAPLVRAHHEKWDGTGYPDGLRGEEIPLGARILSVAAALDALASDRRYRKAVSLERAVQTIASESGTSFDPRVVQLLERRYRELEAKVGKAQQAGLPECGIEGLAGGQRAERLQFLRAIGEARREAQELHELVHELGNSLSFEETLFVLHTRLARLVPHDTIAIYLARDDRLVPELVAGEDARLLKGAEVRIGDGMLGRVANYLEPFINGSPLTDYPATSEGKPFCRLRSSIAVPLEGIGGLVGVLALYRKEPDGFNKDQLRVLLAISSKASLVIENTLRFSQVESHAMTDYLTGLPNARALFLHLDAELARAKRNEKRLAVLVCDLDGFKQMNDRWGHLAGNKVLKEVAAGFRQLGREYDYVARIGGDEFVLVIPDLPEAAVSRKVQELQHMAIHAGFEATGEGGLSASVGSACYPDHGNSAEDLLAEADKQMYAAKRSSRGPADPSAHQLLRLKALTSMR
jgi:diguanylate cyclase (GGDEF)-like protein